MTNIQRFAGTFAFAVLLGLPFFAHANPTIFAIGTSTSAATTSPAYMMPGTGTSTTPVYDAYAQTFAGTPYKTEFAGLLVQFRASSTNSVLNAAVEYSQDGVDWYRNFFVDPSQSGTSTLAFAVTRPFSITWPFASSTVGTATAVNSNISTAAIAIPTPFRYTRVVFSMTGANGAVWSQLVPIKEQR